MDQSLRFMSLKSVCPSIHFSPSLISITKRKERKPRKNHPEKKHHNLIKQKLQAIPAGNAAEISRAIPTTDIQQPLLTTLLLAPSNMSVPRIGSGNGTSQACAACKYQRRKCAPDCILAPYFPHDRQRQFLNAHKLFGVSNITKIIKNLEPPEKDEAMRTIIFQSDVRATDPVGGCYRIIRELQRQIEYNKAELELVLHQLAICRAQAQAQQQIPETATTEEDSVLSYDIVNSEPLVQDYPYIQPQQGEEFGIQNHLQDDVNVNINVNAWTMQDPSVVPTLQVKQDFVNESNEDVKPSQQGQQQLVEIPYERHDVKYEPDQDLVERRFAPSTQLLISS